MLFPFIPLPLLPPCPHHSSAGLFQWPPHSCCFYLCFLMVWCLHSSQIILKYKSGQIIPYLQSSLSFLSPPEYKLPHLQEPSGPFRTLSLSLPSFPNSLDLTSYLHSSGSSLWFWKMPTMSCFKVFVPLPGALLPLDISMTCSLPSFKSRLKYCLFKKTSLVTLSYSHPKELHISLTWDEPAICHPKQNTFESEREPKSGRGLEPDS